LSDPINYLGEIICTSVSSTNKTDQHDIAEILSKVSLNTITLTHKIRDRIGGVMVTVLTSSRFEPETGQRKDYIYIYIYSSEN
jgi:hypothetical protein